MTPKRHGSRPRSFSMTLAGGYTDVETPSSIPNLEAKRIMADNTLPYWDGNVGRCRLVNYSFTCFTFLLFFAITYLFIFNLIFIALSCFFFILLQFFTLFYF